MIFAQENGRVIPNEDKIFALNGRAKKMIQEKGEENVINATIGALLDDDGNLVTLSSVMEVMKTLSPLDYAEYAPIGGTPEFKEAVKKALFGDYVPNTNIGVCSTPGGTGAISLAVANYSQPGDFVLSHDWYWANYSNICAQQGRKLDTFKFFNDEGTFNRESFKENISRLTKLQDSLLVIINTPAHNPTGYSLTEVDWNEIIEVIESLHMHCKITLFVDVAYMDYVGDEDEVRFFIKKLEDVMKAFVVFGYSSSKTFTFYGMRCGALVCLAKDPAIVEEFRRVNEYSARALWSNCAKAPQVVMSKVYSNEEYKAKVAEERAGYRKMLLERGRVFEDTLNKCGVKSVPFDAGFFASISCREPDKISKALEKEGVFCVPLAKGIRVSVASISKEKCVKCAKAIARVMKEFGEI